MPKFKYVNNLSFVFVLSFFLISGCIDQSEDKEVINDDSMQKKSVKLIRGNVVYRERIALPKNAELKISLEDISRMDVASLKIAEIILRDLDTPPYSFELPYDPKQIEPNMTYGLRVRIEANGRLLFTNTSHIPPFDTSADQRLEVVVSHVKGLDKMPAEKDNPDQTKPNANLMNTRWKLLKLNGKIVSTVENGQDIFITMGLQDKLAYGHSGCNTFRGSYTADLATTSLSFGPLASTRKACLHGMEIESEFLKVLESTQSYLIEGDFMAIKDAENKVLANFEALYLR